MEWPQDITTESQQDQELEISQIQLEPALQKRNANTNVKQKMKVLTDLNKQYMIRQANGRLVPLNDLDCCLIAIQEKKIVLTYDKQKTIQITNKKDKKDKKPKKKNNAAKKSGKNKQDDSSKLIVLPFTDMKVNLYNFTVLNKLKETRLIIK